MENNLLYEVAIGMLPKVGAHLTRQLISYSGSAEQVFKQSKGKLLKIPGIGETLANNIINQSILSKAEKEIALAEKNNVTILFYTHKNFPERLKHIPDAPTLLYYKGNADLNAKKTISIVGTRQATSYGKEFVERLLHDLSRHQLVVISGLAYGIDITAHKAALTSNLPTIGVMASGIDIIYPSAHKETAGKMLSNGGLLTEYPFQTKPDAPRFPARNRIIAGLSDAIIVIEAASKGGALITAEIGNSYNKEVFALPGNIGNKYSEGCNLLIRNHKAHILTKAEDIEYIMNWAVASESETSSASELCLNNLNPEEQQLVILLKSGEGIQIDELSWKSQIPVSKLASILLNLEFQGIVKAMPGKKFKLASP